MGTAAKLQASQAGLVIVTIGHDQNRVNLDAWTAIWQPECATRGRGDRLDVAVIVLSMDNLHKLLSRTACAIVFGQYAHLLTLPASKFRISRRVERHSVHTARENAHRYQPVRFCRRVTGYRLIDVSQSQDPIGTAQLGGISRHARSTFTKMSCTGARQNGHGLASYTPLAAEYVSQFDGELKMLRCLLCTTFARGCAVLR